MKYGEFHLETLSKIKEFSQENIARAWLVHKDNFPALKDVTCYTLELWDESMRVPHWHPNASELGYVISGTLQIIIWRSPGETAVFLRDAYISPHTELKKWQGVVSNPLVSKFSPPSTRINVREVPINLIWPK